MKSQSLLLTGALILAAGAIWASSSDASRGAGRATEQASKQASKGTPGLSNGEIERGKYLVEDVAMCGECHTPRDSRGQLINSEWLQGAPIWIMPVHPDANWGEAAPTIAGFPGYTDEDAVNIFERGIGKNGQPIRPPMHYYHMNHEDATAIVAYLRSLPSGH
ncbi:MAG: c-type cytochrome [Candidatus Acidiferrales bacterium]